MIEIPRSYFLRRIKDGFREGKSLQNPDQIKIEQDKASNLLEILKRQVIMIQLGVTFVKWYALW